MARQDYLANFDADKTQKTKLLLERETWKLAAAAKLSSRTIDPTEFHLDTHGRTGKSVDRHVTAVRRSEDAAEAAAECTFKPKLSAATLEMAKNTPYLRHTTFYERQGRGPTLS